MELADERRYLPPASPMLDGDGRGGRAVVLADDRITFDVEAGNRLLALFDLPPVEPDETGVITLDTAGQWRYRPVGVLDRRQPTRLIYERIPLSRHTPSP